MKCLNIEINYYFFYYYYFNVDNHEVIVANDVIESILAIFKYKIIINIKYIYFSIIYFSFL